MLIIQYLNTTERAKRVLGTFHDMRLKISVKIVLIVFALLSISSKLSSAENIDITPQSVVTSSMVTFYRTFFLNVDQVKAHFRGETF